MYARVSLMSASSPAVALLSGECGLATADYIAFWEMVKDRVSPGGVFTAHNVIGQENHMRDFLEAIRSDPNFETTINEASDAGVSVSTRRE